MQDLRSRFVGGNFEEFREADDVQQAFPKAVEFIFDGYRVFTASLPGEGHGLMGLLNDEECRGFGYVHFFEFKGCAGAGV